MKHPIVDYVKEVCGSVRMERKNPKNMGWKMLQLKEDSVEG